jgi:hypothetical protein
MQNSPPLRRPHLRPALAAALLLAALCPSALPAQSDADAGTLTRLDAVVVSSLDGHPVPRVLVTSPDRRMAALTDSQGRFSFTLRLTGPLPETHVFSSWPPDLAPTASAVPLAFVVTRPGYVTNVVNLRLPASPADSDSKAPLQLKITPTATLTGRVYADSDSDSEAPVDRRSVQLVRRQIQDGVANWVPAASAPVSSTGEFRAANLQPGDYKLLLPASDHDPGRLPQQPDSVSGFRAAFYPGVDSLDSATPIHLGPGETAAADLTLRAATFYRVTVPIAVPVDSTANVQTALQPEIPGIYLGRDGNSVSGYLPNGDYDLTLTSASPSASGQTQSIAAVHLHVSGRAVHAEPVALHPGIDIPILVRRELTNSPASTAQDQDQQYPFSLWMNFQPLEANRAMAPLMAPMTPGKDDSALRMENVTPGLFRVIVAPRSGYVAAVTSGSTDLLREPLRVTPGDVPRPIEVTLRDDFASINGTLLAGNAQPPTDTAQIYILAIPLDRLQTPASPGGVGPNNQFVLDNLAPGRYLVLASHQQLLQKVEFRNEDVLRDLLGKGTVVTLASGQKADVQVPLMPDSDDEASQ